jgi:hypothetical protein
MKCAASFATSPAAKRIAGAQPTGFSEPPDCVSGLFIRQWPAVAEPARYAAAGDVHGPGSRVAQATAPSFRHRICHSSSGIVRTLMESADCIGRVHNKRLEPTRVGRFCLSLEYGFA